MRGRVVLMQRAALGGVLGLALLAAAAPARGQDEPARTLLLLGFEGSDARLVEQVAERLRAALGVQVRVLPERPLPDERDAADRRAQVLPFVAEALELQAGGDTEALERRLRAALRGDRRPYARYLEALLDDAGAARLSAQVLAAQAAQAAGARLEAEGVVGVIGVTDRDMTAGEASFLFGHGDRARRAGVISYHRFHEGAEEEVLVRRAAVQALSTTGVLLGLGRCQRETCARAFPNSLEEHDRKQEAFCAACRPAIDRALPNPLRLPLAAELARVHRALAERPDDVARLLERAALRGEVANWSGALAD
ncbi:MAG: hypothetical protein KIT58_18865, partial [Planctomycetota bacterium]|nr:hypothetical protein [Planctomycetota bacterium]